MVADDAAVFRALADPTRRRLLDELLATPGATVGELAAPFEPELTRFAVMKHLRVLEDAGLVVTRRDGRSTRHHLNAVPIRELSRRWLDKFTERTSDALIDLKKALEGTEMTDPALATQVYQVFINATREQVWQALTDPELTAKYFHEARHEFTDGRVVSRGPDGKLYNDSPVDVFDPPNKLVHGWRSLYNEELAKEPMSRVTFELFDEGAGVTRLLLTHDRLDESPGTAEKVQGPGWMFVLSNLKTLLETGAALPEAS